MMIDKDFEYRELRVKECYSYDEYGVYKGITEAYESPLERDVFPLPANATFTAPPVCTPPFVAKWNGQSWEQVEDHRKHLNEIGEYVGGTPYWLSTDNWTSEPRYMAELGALPPNSLLSKPAKPQEVIERENLEREIAEAKQYLNETDYVTLKIIEEPETRPQYETILAKRKQMRAKIDPLQAQVTTLSMKQTV